jgi:hypothetical protein
MGRSIEIIKGKSIRIVLTILLFLFCFSLSAHNYTDTVSGVLVDYFSLLGNKSNGEKQLSQCPLQKKEICDSRNLSDLPILFNRRSDNSKLKGFDFLWHSFSLFLRQVHSYERQFESTLLLSKHFLNLQILSSRHHPPTL